MQIERIRERVRAALEAAVQAPGEVPWDTVHVPVSAREAAAELAHGMDVLGRYEREVVAYRGTTRGVYVAGEVALWRSRVSRSLLVWQTLVALRLDADTRAVGGVA